MSIYALNGLQQQLMFIKNLGRIVNSETDISRLVIMGDWNMTLHRIDKSGGHPWKPTKYRDAILDLMDEINLTDIFRTLNPTKKLSLMNPMF